MQGLEARVQVALGLGGSGRGRGMVRRRRRGVVGVGGVHRVELGRLRRGRGLDLHLLGFLGDFGLCRVCASLRREKRARERGRRRRRERKKCEARKRNERSKVLLLFLVRLEGPEGCCCSLSSLGGERERATRAEAARKRDAFVEGSEGEESCDEESKTAMQKE